jgi:hypothetical protein
VNGSRRTLVVVLLAILLVGELVAGSVIAALDPSKTATQPPSIAVVGDTYTVGRNNYVVWPTLLAQRTGWSVANFALPGAGFQTEGQGGWAFGRQVDRALAAHARTILIMGGLSDEQYAWSGKISQAAVEAINKIKLSGQQALIIGPTWYETPVPASVAAVSYEIQKVAEVAGVPFLGALDPPWLTRDLMQPDLSAPTDKGQSVIADKVAAWLRTEVAG